MNKFIYIGVLAAFSFISCEYFKPTEQKDFVARVNDVYLYQEDIANLINEGTSKEDSAIIINNYITKWATQQLLVDRAKVNLTYEEQEEFNDLVRRYENELYTKAYADAYVAKRLDTTLSSNAIETFYNENRENFRLTEDLVKLRYISISKENTNFSKVKKHFREFGKKDREELNNLVLQFNAYSFNDSVWAKATEVYKRIPLLKPENKNELLKKSHFLELEDSLKVYLVHVNDVKFRNEEAPLIYAEPTIRQILLNRKKLELIKELEKDITKDALKNKKFEINK